MIRIISLEFLRCYACGCLYPVYSRMIEHNTSCWQFCLTHLSFSSVWQYTVEFLPSFLHGISGILQVRHLCGPVNYSHMFKEQKLSSQHHFLIFIRLCDHFWHLQGTDMTMKFYCGHFVHNGFIKIITKTCLIWNMNFVITCSTSSSMSSEGRPLLSSSCLYGCQRVPNTFAFHYLSSQFHHTIHHSNLTKLTATFNFFLCEKIISSQTSHFIGFQCVFNF